MDFPGCVKGLHKRVELKRVDLYIRAMSLLFQHILSYIANMQGIDYCDFIRRPESQPLALILEAIKP